MRQPRRRGPEHGVLLSFVLYIRHQQDRGQKYRLLQRGERRIWQQERAPQGRRAWTEGVPAVCGIPADPQRRRSSGRDLRPPGELRGCERIDERTRPSDGLRGLQKSCEDGPRNLNKKIKEEKSLFKVFYPELYLFTKATEDLLKDYLKGVDFSIKTRSEERLPNYLQKHYIRVNIKRTFMNTYLLIALNKLLEEAGFNVFFEKFPQSFANNVTKEKCKILMNMRLKEIFRARDLYEDIDNTNFEHNLKIVDEIEKEGNPELNMILNRKLRCLFEEYVDSEEFGIVELNRLKKSKVEKDEYYLKKYVFLAKHFIEFCMSDDE